MKKYFQSLLNANSVREVTDVVIGISEDFQIDWVPVGGRRDNIATINIGTDPAAGITERITNAIDAVLELEWQKNGMPVDIPNPRVATETWFNIPDGRLHLVENTKDKKIQELAQRIKVKLKDSERESYPTVEIRDSGIGLKGEDFSKTILSLHGGNKIQKLFLMGAFGQGGSTALSYNNYTVIASKPYFTEKGTKPTVSFTIVRINQGDVNKDKHEWFEYCVNRKNGQPLSVEVDDKLFSHGTLVKHIAMDLGKYTAAMTQPTGSLWYLAHHYLFDPILPFYVSDERTKKIKKEGAQNRGIYGNNRRLSKGGGEEKNLTQYQRSVRRTFKDGKVNIYYWVLTLEGDKPWERIKNYTNQSNPFIITFNGQKQGYLHHSIIKHDLKLPFLEKYLIVQIECDLLDNESKRQLFSSTRESLRETSILDELKKLAIDTLNEDDKLRQLDKERKDRYMKKDDTEAVDKLRRRLATRINQYAKSAGTGKGVTATETKESVKTKKQAPIPFSDPPTFLEITTPEPKDVYVGKTFTIKFRTDAHPSHFYNPDNFLAVIEPHSFGSFTGNANVVDGYGIAYFKCREDISVGTDAKITLELRPRGQKTLSDSIEVVAIEMPENTDVNKKGEKNAPNIIPQFINENDPYYKEHNWNYDTVADVDITNEAVYIYINDSNKNITKLVERAQKYSTQAVDSIKNRYREHIGFCAYMISENGIEEKLSKEEGKEISPDVVESIKKADLSNACEAICDLINDFFQVVITENQELVS